MLVTAVTAVQILYLFLLTTWCLISGECPDSSWSESTSGSCYKILQFSMNMGPILTASERCKAERGELASLRTQDDYNLGKTLLLDAKGFASKYFAYIGANDVATEGQFNWLDGSGVDPEQWTKNEPNDMNGEDCVVLGKKGFGEEFGLYDLLCCDPWNYDVKFILCEHDETSSMSDEIFYRKCSPELFTATTTLQTTENVKAAVQTTQGVTTNLQTTEAATTAVQTTAGTTTAVQTTEGATTAVQTTENDVTTEQATESVTTYIQTTENATTITQTTGENRTTLTETEGDMSDSFTGTTADVTNKLNTSEGSNATSTEHTNATVTTTAATSYMNDIRGRYTSPRFPPIYITGRCCKKSQNLDDLRIVRTNLSSYKRTKVSVGDERHSVCFIGIISLILIFVCSLLLCASDFKRIWRDVKSAIRRQPIQMKTSPVMKCASGAADAPKRGEGRGGGN